MRISVLLLRHTEDALEWREDLSATEVGMEIRNLLECMLESFVGVVDTALASEDRQEIRSVADYLEF